MLGAVPPSWRTATVAARRPRSLPVRRRRHRRGARAGRAGRERRQVPRRPAGDRPQPGAGALPGRARQPAPGGDGGPVRRPRRRAARACSSARWCAPRSTTGRSCARSTRSSSGTATHQSARYELSVGGAQRAPVLVGPDRGDRHRRDRLGAEHQPPVPARRCPGRPRTSSRGSCARPWESPATGATLTAGLLDAGSALAVTERDRRRGVRRRDRGRPPDRRLGPARDDRSRVAPAQLGPVTSRNVFLSGSSKKNIGGLPASGASPQ